ncbi:MAG TPA: tetratricopeptide repeat protein [Longimicrobium sp.]|nr:tetratricopeptide repeat protein [Longimicrobium sp.]
MRRPLLLSTAALLALAFDASAGAQQRTPPRPRLAAQADTNDAAAYYAHGVAKLEDDPRQAADAFWWAARLNPAWADPLYARRVALHAADARRFVRYMERDARVVRSPEVQAIDSLHLRALTLDPFLYPRHDRFLLQAGLSEAIDRAIKRDYGLGAAPSAAERAQMAREMMTDASPAARAWLAFSSGDFPSALRNYDAALRTARWKSELYADKARVLYLTGAYGASLEAMRLALEEKRKEDRRDLVFVYESKALYEHSIGNVLERLGRPGEAREAYGRALTEDLAFHPAHVRLSRLALAAGDTATAVSEMELAVQIRGDDPALRMEYARVLAEARRHAEAAAELRRAVELDPDYAEPYQMLGRIHDASGMTEEALGFYDQFTARAARTDPLLEWTRQRAAALRAAPGG